VKIPEDKDKGGLLAVKGCRPFYSKPLKLGRQLPKSEETKENKREIKK